MRKMKKVDDYFSGTENIQEKTIYQFFKKEIKSQDIKMAHTDVSIIGNSAKKREYVGALWKIPNYHKTIPWLRIGIPYDDISPALEIVLPVFHGDMPDLWSKGKGYFRLVIRFTFEKHGPTLQMFTNPVGLQESSEIINIITAFHRKIKTYSVIN